MPDNSMTITKISIKFRLLMSKGNVNGALKLLTNNLLPLTDLTLQLLKQKHLEARELPPEVLMEGLIRKIHPVVYDDIDESFSGWAFFRVAHEWRRVKKAPLLKICYTYPTMMKRGTLIP